MTITLTWWMIPTIITISSICYAIFIHKDVGGGYLNGIGNILMLIPALFISMMAWLVAALLK